MASTRAQQAQRTRQAILDTARRLFHEHGYDATSLQRIADAMGVTKANVYYYFRTKAAILEALLRPLVDAQIAVIDAAAGIGDRDARLRFLVDGVVGNVVTAYRTMGPLNLGDPAMRRELPITRELDDLSVRALGVLYGDAPTPDQEAGFWMTLDLAPALRRLASRLDDDALRGVLARMVLRTLDV
jgi:AcrR family transcriptional regulator